MDKINHAINYEYQMLRYRPDAVSGEFVNIGIVFFDVDNRVLCTQITEKHDRITQFFGHTSNAFLLKTTQHIEHEFHEIAERMATENNVCYKSITEITSSVLPINDNGLFFSDVHKGWHFDFKSAFDATFERLVGRYNAQKSVNTKNNRRDEKSVLTSNYVSQKWFESLKGDASSAKSEERKAQTNIEKEEIQMIEDIFHSSKNRI